MGGDRFYLRGAVSQDGTIMAIGDRGMNGKGANVWLSKDKGSTWIEVSKGKLPQKGGGAGLAMSADGQVIYVCGALEFHGWVTTNGGDTWTASAPHTSPNAYWYDTAMSSDGKT